MGNRVREGRGKDRVCEDKHEAERWYGQRRVCGYSRGQTGIVGIVVVHTSHSIWHTSYHTNYHTNCHTPGIIATGTNPSQAYVQARTPSTGKAFCGRARRRAVRAALFAPQAQLPPTFELPASPPASVSPCGPPRRPAVHCRRNTCSW